jgi:cytochrome b involved in lipid metabolism
VTDAPSADAVSGSDTPATDPPATDPTHSLAEIAQHGSRSSCWAAVNGVVYDLTAWIDQHPGGTGEILGICGTDATAMFQDEHEGDREPQQELMQFRIGQLQ